MTGKRDVRPRILDATVQLLREGGVQAATPAAVAERAGAAKMSLYRHFAGKDEMIAAALQDFQPRQQALLLDDPLSATPRERLLAVFERAAQRADRGDARACVYVTCRLEAGPEHPVADVARDYKRSFVAAIEAELVELGHARASTLAPVIAMLLDGSIIHAVIAGDGGPIRAARAALPALLDQLD